MKQQIKKTYSLTKIKDKRINIFLKIITQSDKGFGKVTIVAIEKVAKASIKLIIGKIMPTALVDKKLTDID